MITPEQLARQQIDTLLVEFVSNVWAGLDTIAAAVPAEAWDVVPEDLSVRADEFACGDGSMSPSPRTRAIR